MVQHPSLVLRFRTRTGNLSATPPGTREIDYAILTIEEADIKTLDMSTMTEYLSVTKAFDGIERR